MGRWTLTCLHPGASANVGPPGPVGEAAASPDRRGKSTGYCVSELYQLVSTQSVDGASRRQLEFGCGEPTVDPGREACGHAVCTPRSARGSEFAQFWTVVIPAVAHRAWRWWLTVTAIAVYERSSCLIGTVATDHEVQSALITPSRIDRWSAETTSLVPQSEHPAGLVRVCSADPTNL